MKINFTPQIRADELLASIVGDVLTINGTSYDFAHLAEGATLPREAVGCDLLASDVTREGGVIHLTLILPYWGDAPDGVRFPKPITVTRDGPIAVPGSGG